MSPGLSWRRATPAMPKEWHGKLEEAREKAKGNRKPAPENSLLAEAVVEMFEIGAIRFEPVTLKSGLVSPYYNNLRILASYPPLMKKVSALLAERMKSAGLSPDIVIGIAEAGIPLAVGLSLHSGIPGGYVRSAAKAHGTKRMVEGAWKEGAQAVLVDDVVSDGASKLEVLGHLQEAGLRVRDILVVVDRGQGGVQLMERNGLRCHAVATMDDVLSILLDAGKIDPSQVEEAHRFMKEAQAAA
jgi:uridine monophosphate synthetase